MNRLKIIICAAAIAIFVPILAVQANESQTIPIQTPTISTNQNDVENLMRGPKTTYSHSTSNSVPASEKKSTKKSEVKSTTSTSKSTTKTTTKKTTTKQTKPITKKQTYHTSELKYSAAYFRNAGNIEWCGYHYTYYSDRILPGYGLNIPGRHYDENGYICDGDGYLCVANDALPRYSIVDTPFGKQGKVYDRGCGYSTIDVYVNW